MEKENENKCILTMATLDHLTTVMIAVDGDQFMVGVQLLKAEEKGEAVLAKDNSSKLVGFIPNTGWDILCSSEDREEAFQVYLSAIATILMDRKERILSHAESLQHKPFMTSC